MEPPRRPTSPYEEPFRLRPLADCPFHVQKLVEVLREELRALRGVPGSELAVDSLKKVASKMYVLEYLWRNK